MTLDELKQLRERQRVALSEYERLTVELVAGVRELRGTMPATELARELGLSRARLYQMFDQ